MTRKHFTIAVLLLAAACGEEAPATYAEMDFDQRIAFMTEVVLPEMREVCHGSGASDGTYAMPSPDLPRLPASEEAFFAYLEEDPEHARWGQFMMEETWPRMAELLAAPVFDPVTEPEGSSCSDCHMHDGQ
jgi:hypothetical protein